MALPLRTHPPAVVQSIPPDLASPSAAHSTAACPKAISIYAMQKTGSTFLGRFSREITLHKKMCRTYQNTKEYVCQTTIYVDCPRNSHHRKTVSLKQTFSTQLPEHKGRARCNSMLRRKMFDSANDWLRSTNFTVRYRYNRSLDWLFRPVGFSRGPLRQLYTEYADGAVPGFPGYHNALIVHTRHPVEMMVSAFHCIANPSVCPVRNKLLGAHVPKNDTIRSLDEFVLAGLKRQGSTPYAILQRNLAISHFMKGFTQSNLYRVASSRGCSSPTLLHSKYELMVTNFSLWAKQLLEHVVDKPGQRRTLHRTLVAQFRNDFVPDGKHKHALVAGSNIRKLRPTTVQQLTRDTRLSGLLSDLGYDWFGLDRVSHTLKA